MRRLVLAAILLFIGLHAEAADRSRSAAEVGGTVASAVEPPVSRIDRLEQWLKAVVQHEPGSDDEAVAAVGSWSIDHVRTLWIDASNLLLAMRNPGIARFDMRQPGRRTSQPIRYTANELHRLKMLACALSGSFTRPDCLASKAAIELDTELVRLSRLAAEARLQGDDNYLVRRGALLHTDVAMLNPGTPEPVNAGTSLGPQTIKMQIADGRELYLGETAVHWETARMLLDHVKPPGRLRQGSGEPRRSEAEAGAARPDPGRDEMVRRWYRATAAWMQWRQNYDTQHLERARQIFPNDPDILFLSGTLHESYAGSRIQNAVRSAVLPTGVRFDLGSDRGELRQAEALYRRTIAVKPDFAEAHLHFGRVLFELERPAEAAIELTEALASTDDDLVKYYGELFLGAARQAKGELDAAAVSYARAAELQPAAQSPLIALSALARVRGDRGGALREMRRVFALSSNESSGDDPWWTYHRSHARNAEELLEEMWETFRQ